MLVCKRAAHCPDGAAQGTSDPGVIQDVSIAQVNDGYSAEAHRRKYQLPYSQTGGLNDAFTHRSQRTSVAAFRSDVSAIITQSLSSMTDVNMTGRLFLSLTQRLEVDPRWTVPGSGNATNFLGWSPGGHGVR